MSRATSEISVVICEKRYLTSSRRRRRSGRGIDHRWLVEDHWDFVLECFLERLKALNEAVAPDEI